MSGRSASRSAAVLAVAATALLPAIAHGMATYGGTTRQGEGVVVATSSPGSAARRLVLAFRAECTSGGRFAFHEVVPVISAASAGEVPLGRLLAERNSRGVLRGQVFDAGPTAAGSAAIQVGLTARITRTAVTGTIDATVVEIDQPGIQPATEPPDGATIIDRCATGPVRFTARRSPRRIYGGATSQGEPVVLRVDAARRNLTEAVVGWHGSCAPDGAVDYPDDLKDFPLRNGRFSDVFTWSPQAGTTFSYRFSGTIGRTSARGRLAVDVATGARTCSTTALTWSATTG